MRICAPLVALLVLSCGKSEAPPPPPLGLADGCQPLLGGHDCLLPYPSNYFLVDDPSLPSGKRIELTKVSKVRTAGGPADPNLWKPADGYSQIPTLVTAWPSGATLDGFVNVNGDYASSTSDSSQSLWIEVGTHERIAHYVDLDPRAKTPERQAMVIHPVVGLKPRTRYIFAIRNAKGLDGSTLAAPEGFRRIRDHLTKGDGQLDPVAQRFEAEIFPELEAAGVNRSELQLAWDFTTGSTEHVTADMLRVRELTLAWLASNTPAVTINSVDENPNTDVWRLIKGSFEAPLFMETAEPGAALARDGSGVVKQNGMVTVPFQISVPTSVRDAYEPGRALLYGHGFFGSADELTYGGARGVSEATKSVMFAVDWWGMSGQDVGVVAADMTGKPADTLRFTDRIHQGVANWIVFTRAVAGPLRSKAELLRPASGPGTSTGANGSNAGQPVYGAKVGAYLGISQGHILGGTMAAMNPDLDRIALNVGGAGFTHMMMRARPFSGFLLLIENAIPDPLDQQKYIAQLQAQFDRTDPATYARFLLKEQLPGNAPDRRILFQTGLGDTSVPNVGAFLHARLIGLPLLQPAPRSIYGLQPVDAPTAQSAVALYDFGIDTALIYKDASPQPDGTPVHEGLRALTAARAQMDRFWTDGTIVNACSGVCDPE